MRAGTLEELHRDRAGSIEAAGARLEEPRKEETGLEPSLVLYYLATLMKYGDVREEDKDGTRFRYGLVADRSPEPGARSESG